MSGSCAYVIAVSSPLPFVQPFGVTNADVPSDAAPASAPGFTRRLPLGKPVAAVAPGNAVGANVAAKASAMAVATNARLRRCLRIDMGPLPGVIEKRAYFGILLAS